MIKIYKKSYFLILEILIAFLLISLTVLPFTSYPYKVFKKELSYLESMVIEPYFLVSFLDIMKNIDNSDYALDPIQIPFGRNSSLYVERTKEIPRRQLENHSNNELICILLTIKSKNTKQARRKYFYLKKNIKKVKNEI